MKFDRKIRNMRAACDIAVFGTADPKRIKRIERTAFGYDGNHCAWRDGRSDACEGREYRNPYPPGTRHDEFKRGYMSADPLGDWHGRNV